MKRLVYDGYTFLTYYFLHMQLTHVLLRGSILMTELSVVTFGLFISESTNHSSQCTPRNKPGTSVFGADMIYLLKKILSRAHLWYSEPICEHMYI